MTREERIAAMAPDLKPRRTEPAPELAPSGHGERNPAAPATVRLATGTAPPAGAAKTAEFAALPPIHGVAGVNPLVRRLALTGAAIVILGTAAFLLFGPPRTKGDELADLEAEATMPKLSDSRAPLNRPLIPGTSGASQATVPGTSTPPLTAPRDTVEHKTPPQAAAETSMERLVMPAWHLQVASLRDSSTADQLGRRLATLGQVSFHVDRTRGDEIPWFAVYLGPYGTRAEAESAKVELGALDRHVAQAIVRPPTTR